MINLLAWQSLLFVIVFFSASLWFHNTFRNRWWSWVIIIVASILNSYFFIRSPAQWLLFIIGSVAYFILDTISVYKKQWSYNTKNSYVYWAGPGWGFVTVVVQDLFRNSPTYLIVVLLLIAMLILSSRSQKEFKVSNYIGKRWMWFALLGFYLIPKLFLISLAMGILLEFAAVTVFKTWSYPKPVFLLIGIGYGTLMVFIQAFFILLQGNISSLYLVMTAGLTLLLVLENVSVIKAYLSKK